VAEVPEVPEEPEAGSGKAAEAALGEGVMGKKLTEGERKFLSAIQDIDIGNGKVLGARLLPCDFPKGTSSPTINNLWVKGYVRLGYYWLDELPYKLTEKGKEALKAEDASGRLTEGERKFLSAIPEDRDYGNGNVYPGRLLPYEFPKGTRYATISNLRRKGYVCLGYHWLRELPCRLTKKGKEALKAANMRLVSKEQGILVVVKEARDVVLV
jgi:hypothetical protein